MSEVPVRVEIAARLLGVDEQTVRKCVATGLLFAAEEQPHLLLDPVRLHEVVRLIADLRTAGTKDHELLDHLWHRLNDEAWLDDADFVESLAQMARCEYSTVYFHGEPAQD